MISNRLYFSLKMVKDRLVQNIWVSALFLVSCLFTFPIQAALIFQRFVSDIGEKYASREQAAEYVTRILGQQNMIFKITLIIAALVMGWAFYSYMHSKKQVDLYHSLPVSRTRIFLSNFLAGNISFVIIYLGNLFLAAAVISVIGFGADIDYLELLRNFAMNTVYFNLIFSVSILAGLITGTRLIHVLMTFVILEYVQLFLVLFSEYMKFFFSTFYARAVFTDDLIMNLSPVTSLFMEMESFSFTMTANVLVLACIILLNVYIFNLRPSESAGKSIIRNRLLETVKYMVLTAGTMAGGLIFNEVGQGRSWMIFGLVFSGFVGHCILECLLSFDMKRIFRNKGKLVILMCALAIAFLVMDRDVAGYDMRIPETGSIESVSINPVSFDSYASYNLADYDEIDRMESIRLSNPDTIKAVTEIAEISVKNQEKHESDKNFVSGDHFQLAVKYNLKDGKSLTRYYSHAPAASALEVFADIYDTSEFKYRYYPLMSLKPEEIIKATAEFPGFVNPDNKNSYESEIRGSEKMKALLSAAQNDLINMSSSKLKNNSPVALLTFFVQDDIKGRYAQDSQRRIEVPVFREYIKTLSVLASLGYRIETDFFEDMVEYIELYSYDDSASAKPDYPQTVDVKESVKVLREKAEIEKFFTEYISGINISYNGFILPDSNRWAIVYLKGSSNSGYDFISVKDVGI